jgi:hypothetical protein
VRVDETKNGGVCGDVKKTNDNQKTQKSKTTRNTMRVTALCSSPGTFVLADQGGVID